MTPRENRCSSAVLIARSQSSRDGSGTQVVRKVYAAPSCSMPVNVPSASRSYLPSDGSDTHILAALDAASDALGNTRSVARAHYVHPEVIDGYTSGELERFMTGKRTKASTWLEVDERLLLAYLAESLEARAGEFATNAT